MVGEQIGGDFGEVANRAAFAVRVAKSDPLDRPIASDANRARKKRIASYLAGHAAAIELQHEFVSRHFAHVVGHIGFSTICNAPAGNFNSFSNFLPRQPSRFTTVTISPVVWQS